MSRLSDDPINFTEEEARGLIHPHSNAINVTLQIAVRKVHHILIDNESSVDICFTLTLNQMNLVGQTMTPVRTPLYGFSGESIHTNAELELPVELRDTPCQQMNFPSVYNAIIVRPTLNTVRELIGVCYNNWDLLVLSPLVVSLFCYFLL